MYDLESFNTDTAVLYCVCLYPQSKIESRYDRDLTNEGYCKCEGDTIVFDGTDCISNFLDWLVFFKWDYRNLKIKNVEFELQLLAHNGNSFDTYVVLNSLSNWQRIVNIVKKEKGIIYSKNFNRKRKLSENKYVPQYRNVRYGMTHINRSFKNVGTTYWLRK